MTVKLSWSGGTADFRDRVTRACNAGLTAAVAVAADTAARSLGTDHGGAPSAPYAYPNSQSGQLRNSIHYASPEALGTPLRAAFGVGGTGIPYARIIEQGGVVTAKTTKYLPVPVNKAAQDMLRRLTPSTGPAASLRSQRLKFIKGKKNAMLVEMTPSGKKEKTNGARFVLKRSIYIAPRPYLRPAASVAGPAMIAAFKEAAQRSLQGKA